MNKNTEHPQISSEITGNISGHPVPEWRTAKWFNTTKPLTLSDLRGRVVMVCAFQMLCPGGLNQGLPHAQRVVSLFQSSEVAVIGLHSGFRAS